MSSIKNISTSNKIPKDLAKKLGSGGIKLILAVMWLCYHDLKKENCVTLSTREDVITEDLYAKIYDRWTLENRASQVKLRLIPYTQYTDETMAKKRGKPPTIDFCFRAWNKNDGYFGAECKRLCAGDKSLIQGYVEEGVKRFATGKYGSKSSVSAMIGYVLLGEISDIIDQIKPAMKDTNLEQNLTRELFEVNPQYKSVHIRNLDLERIVLHHLFFDFAA